MAGAQCLLCVKTIDKPKKNCGFCKCPICSYCMLACATKPRKMRFQTLQNCLWTVQNQTRSTPERKKNDQHEQQTPNKGPSDGPERKNSQHSAQMCQHRATYVSSGLHFGSFWPPLVRTCSMLMQAKNAVGFNTPGAASSAADLEAQDPPKSKPKPEKIDVEK